MSANMGLCVKGMTMVEVPAIVRPATPSAQRPHLSPTLRTRRLLARPPARLAQAATMYGSDESSRPCSLKPRLEEVEAVDVGEGADDHRPEVARAKRAGPGQVAVILRDRRRRLRKLR